MRQKLLLTLAFVLSATCSYAQDDDWQISGGRDDSPTEYSRQFDSREDVAYTRRSGLFGDHKESFWSATVGYTNKNWKTNANGTVMHENFFGEEGKKFHGFYFGANYQPTFNFGLGFRTGLLAEVYISKSNFVKDKDFDDYTELSLYIPLHAAYRLPIGYKSSISLYGGLGINYAVVGTYTQHRYYFDYYTDEWIDDPYNVDQRYGSGWPKRFNASWEVGAAVNIKSFKIECTYSRGLTSHHLDPHQQYDSKQNKFSLGIGYVFSDF